MPAVTVSPQKKWEVVTAYLALGNMMAVSVATGIPAATIRTWKLQPWWRELEGIIKEEEGTEQSAKLRVIVDKTLNIIADRLEHGDFQYDPKTGGLIRRPVLLRDAGKVGLDVMNKKEAVDQLKLQKLKQPSVEESLKRIADEFASIARRVHGPELQEGVRQLPREAGANREPLEAEFSSCSDGEGDGEGHQGGRGSQGAADQGWLEQAGQLEDLAAFGESQLPANQISEDEVNAQTPLANH